MINQPFVILFLLVAGFCLAVVGCFVAPRVYLWLAAAGCLIFAILLKVFGGGV